MIHPTMEPAGLSHFGGVCLGLLVMAIVSASRVASVSVLALFAFLGLVATAVVVISIPALSLESVRVTKFGPGATSIWWAIFRLPKFALPLPGLPPEGKVNPNALAGLASSLFPIAIGMIACGRIRELGARRWIFVLAGVLSAIVTLVALLITFSRSSIAALLLTTITIGLLVRRLRPWTLFGCVIASLAVFMLLARPMPSRPAPWVDANQSIGVRMTVWKLGWEAFSHAPILGTGINRFHPRIQSDPRVAIPEELPHAHNTFLQVALDIGGIGLIAYVAVLWTILGRAIQQQHYSSLDAIISAGTGLSIVTMHFFGLGDAIALGAKIGVVQWWCAGIILAIARQSSEPKSLSINNKTE
jgi:O-antigen ligase